MPIYTYRCENCGIQFDKRQHFTDEPLKTCPECGKPALRKVFQPVGIVFKGSGFYATDHRSPSGVTPPTRSSGTKDESKAESKTETEASSKND